MVDIMPVVAAENAVPGKRRIAGLAEVGVLRAGIIPEDDVQGSLDVPDAAAKKRIDQIWCSQAIAVKSTRVVFNGLQEPQVSDHAGVLIEL